MNFKSIDRNWCPNRDGLQVSSCCSNRGIWNWEVCWDWVNHRGNHRDKWWSSGYLYRLKAGYLWPREISLAQIWHDWFRLRRCERRNSHPNVLCLSQSHLRRVDGMDVEEIQDGVLKLKWSKIYIFDECLWRCSGHGNDRRISQMAMRFSFGEFRPWRCAGVDSTVLNVPEQRCAGPQCSVSMFCVLYDRVVLFVKWK